MSSKLGGSLRSAMQHAKREAITHGRDGSMQLPLEQVTLPTEQPRRYFDPDASEALEASIKARGILQPLLVRPLEQGRFELVAGERRYRAAKTLGLDTIPVLVAVLTDAEAKEAALTENLQRVDINPVEETEAILQLLALKLSRASSEVVSLLYARHNHQKTNPTHNVMGNEDSVIDEFFTSTAKMTWASFVTNRLPLLRLPEDVLETLRRGEIAYTKALLVARVKDGRVRARLLKRVREDDLSVDQVRSKVKELRKTPAASAHADLEERVSKLPKLLKRSRFLEDDAIRQRVEALTAELEAILGKVKSD